jgi:DNA-binding MarR family transcriptional regulator
MDMECDKDTLSQIASEIDWESFSPELRLLTGSPRFYLMKVVHRWQKQVREQLVDYDITSTQFTLLTSLMVMTKDGKVTTQADLSNFLKVDKMMVSDVLRTLEKKGYIVRESHPTDRRARSLVVTKKGLDLIEVTMKSAVSFDERFFAPLGDEKDDFIRMLKKLQ